MITIPVETICDEEPIATPVRHDPEPLLAGECFRCGQLLQLTEEQFRSPRPVCCHRCN